MLRAISIWNLFGDVPLKNMLEVERKALKPVAGMRSKREMKSIPRLSILDFSRISERWLGWVAMFLAETLINQ